jgi:hypothetical protein
MQNLPKIALAACFAAALLAAAAPAGAQVADSGSFHITIEGRDAGTEEFVIVESGTGTAQEVVATGRVRIRLPEGTLELDPRVTTRGIGADPVEYQVQVGGTTPGRIVGAIGGGRMSARIVTPTGEQLREYVASSGAVVLEDVVAHHYHFLARRAHQGRVPIIVPRENRQVMATVVHRGESRVRVGGTEVTLFHLVVQPAGGVERHVWVDALNRVMRVEIPARGYVAERTRVPR